MTRAWAGLVVFAMAIAGCKREAPRHESEPTAAPSEAPSTVASASASAPAPNCGPRHIAAADGGCARDPAWRIEQIAVAANYACARYASGDVGCAGFRTPAGAENVHDAVEIAAGALHACARQKSGSVVCWGKDDYGQVGDATRLAGVTAIAAGDSHTCAIHAGGKVACWGSSFEGQVDGKKGADHRVPVDVPGVAGATKLALGLTFSCARLGDGSVTCWGAFPRDRDDRGPRVVAGLHGVDDISLTGAAFHPTLCARTGGSVRCIAGEGHATPKLVTGISDATTVVAGNLSICALEKSGVVACADEPFDKAAAFPVPPARSVSMRGLNVCTIGVDGELACRQGDGKPLDDIFRSIEAL